MKTTEQKIDELIARKLVQAQSDNYKQMDELEWLAYKREQTRKQLKRSRQHIQSTYKELTAPTPMPKSKWGMATFLLSKGVTIIEGVSLGYKFGNAIKSIMALKNIFRSKD